MFIKASEVLTVIQDAIDKHGDLPLNIHFVERMYSGTTMHLYLLTNKETGKKSFLYTSIPYPYGTPRFEMEVISKKTFENWECIHDDLWPRYMNVKVNGNGEAVNDIAEDENTSQLNLFANRSTR